MVSTRFRARWFVLILCAAGVSGYAEDFFSLESVGARGGFPADSRGDGFHQAEAFVNFDLPWRFGFKGLLHDGEYRFRIQSEFSAGWLGRESQAAFIATAGLVLVARHEDWPVFLQGGCLPTFISRDQFGDRDIGSLFQFTTYGGINWDMAGHVRLGYRFQHMSNAGLGRHNPGLNFHVAALSYAF
jgi:hypothetical protein